MLAGDFNVVPTDFDIYKTKSWNTDALVQPAPRERFLATTGAGLDGRLSARCIRSSRCIRSGTISGTVGHAMQACG